MIQPKRAVQLIPPHIRDIIAELEREQHMRRQVYPGMIANGRLTQRTADFRHACLDAAIDVLRSLPPEAA